MLQHQLMIGKARVDSRLIIFAVLFLVSGCAGLIYEIVWVRLLELYFGVTMVSITLIVAAYMGGLGLGSLAGGRMAIKLKSVLFTYAIVEIGVGIFGLFSPLLITGVGQLTSGSSYYLVFFISFALLLIPTFLMGMTLPLLSQAFIDQVDISGRVVGLLYGINTIGAAFGAVLAGYVLIGWVGFGGTIVVACSLNILVGISAILVSRKEFGIKTTPSQSRSETGKGVRHSTPWKYHNVLLASFLVGFIGLGYEMLWIRVLSIFNKSSTYSFPTILFIFLTGLAISGYYWGQKSDKTSEPEALFWKLELGVGILAAVSVFFLWKATDFPIFINWLNKIFGHSERPVALYVLIDSNFAPWWGRFVKDMLTYWLLPVVVMLPACLMMGGGLPILDRIAINSAQMAGKKVGDVHLANIGGSVAGTLIVSFLFLPYLGSEITLKLLLLLSLSFLVLFLMQRKARDVGLNRVDLTMIGLPAIVLLSLVILPGKGELYSSIYKAATNDDVLFYESGDSIFALTKPQGTSIPSRLWIGGDINSIFPSNGVYESRALACMGATQPRRILIIGLGGANTAYFYSTMPDVQEIVIVELYEDLGPFMESSLPHVKALLKDSRVKYVADDGRRYLYAHPEEKFDLITTDPLRRYWLGHDSLYSQEMMSLYASHLTDGGVLCEWQDENRILPLTTATVFREVDNFNDFAIASNQPIRYSLENMNNAKNIYMAKAVDYNINSTTVMSLDPISIFGRFQCNREQILANSSEIPVLTDLQPLLEYYLFKPPLDSITPPCEAPIEDLVSRIDGCDSICKSSLLPSSP
jgi:spermidine synthase